MNEREVGDVKTVIKPSSPPHPAEVNEHLGLAYQLCNKLIEAAELRGDQAGADAWLVARNAIEAAEKTMREAREKQTWRSVQGERVYSTIASRKRSDPDPLGRTAERERIADLELVERAKHSYYAVREQLQPYPPGPWPIGRCGRCGETRPIAAGLSWCRDCSCKST